jgi:hypothetical protein
MNWNDKEELREYHRKTSNNWYHKNKEKALLSSKKWRMENPDKMKLAKKRWNYKNRLRRKEAFNQWLLKNKDHVKEYQNERYKNNEQVKLKKLIASSINTRIKRRGLDKEIKGIFRFLPYTTGELARHIEKRFLPGMTWKNHGKWHIDHIIADAKFKYDSVNDKEFQKCWALDNLQPLWAEDNLRKSKY